MRSVIAGWFFMKTPLFVIENFLFFGYLVG
jgi:hypothetical protein